MLAIELVALVLVQPLERDRGRGSHAATPSRPLLEQLVPGNAQKQDGRAADPLREALDQVQERRLCPMDVVQDEDNRLVRRK